ncbi:Ribosomal protein S5 [Gracilaria domingensis]|nr:Ribosomal protein S5 [Gracilaria domingensis]
MLRATLLQRSLHSINRGLCLKRLKYNRALTSDVGADVNANGQTKDSNSDPEEAGRSLAKLSRMAQELRKSIEREARHDLQHPELLVTLEQEVDEAYDIIRKALDRAGRPCTIEELGDRINKNIVSVPVEALGYRDLLRADLLRDQIERTLVSLQVLPPQEAMVDGSDKPFGRPDKKSKQQPQGLTEAEESNEQDGDSEEKVEVLKELRAVSAEELKKRKAYMEDAIKMENVLSGYDTALLEVGRVHKVTKGGTTFSLRALVVIGNRNGTAGYGEGKSDNQHHAIERACRDAKRNLLHINLRDERTIAHRIRGQFVKSKVSLWPAPQGTGISANNNFTAVLQLFGVKDVGAKLHGPRSLTNAIKALFNALSRLQTDENIKEARGLATLVNPPLPAKNSSKRRFRAL